MRVDIFSLINLIIVYISHNFVLIIWKKKFEKPKEKYSHTNKQIKK